MREWLSPILPAGAATDGQKSQETDVPPSHVHIDEDDQDMFGRREMEALIGRIRERLGQAGYALDTPPTEVDAFDREVKQQVVNLVFLKKTSVAKNLSVS